jgi:bifunctional NMN adenylyltransferase/nudix hydrolase
MKHKLKHDVGVIIGRFQTPELTKGHRELIEHVIETHQKVLVLVGYTPGVFLSSNDPLDPATRVRMINHEYPQIVVRELPDQRSDSLWSQNVDFRIDCVFQIGTKVIYGSRDSFIPFYDGKYDTIELESSQSDRATEYRRKINNTIGNSKDFRHGIIYASNNRFPVVYHTVDVIPISNDSVLVGKKTGDKEYRFIGGFIDVKDNSAEIAALRELKEETGVYGELSAIKYIGSCTIGDFRYRKSQDSIMTSVFILKYEHRFGKPTANDDIESVKWVPVSDLKKDIIDCHLPIYELLKGHLNG